MSRMLLLAGLGTMLLAASGCARPQSADRTLQYRVVALPGGAGTVLCGLAPSRAPAAPGFAAGVAPLAGGFDWGLWGPFPEDATLPVDVIAFGGGCIFYVPGFAVGLVASVLTFPVLGLSTFLWLPGDCGSITGTVGYYLLGVPFYALQKVLWDAPCAFGRFLSLHCRSYKGQVDWLIPRVADTPRGKEAYRKLKQLTGEDFGSRETWEKWWAAHRDEFDRRMKRVGPAPEPAAPVVQGAAS